MKSKEAFPIHVLGGPEAGYHPGMTLREYYAGQAMVGVLASGQNLLNQNQTADFAVKHADALIAALERKR